MEDMIDTFLDAYFSEEAIAEIYKSFSLFDFFEYKEAYVGLIDIIDNSSLHSTDTAVDLFTQELNKQLDYMLKEHTIILTPEATLYHKNEILRSLGHLQRLEDYTMVIRILESTLEDEEQLATIIEDTSMLELSEIMSVIQEFDPAMLQTLKDYIYSKEDANEEHLVVSSKILENIRVFKELYGDSSLGIQMVENGALIGDRFRTYLVYVENDILSKDDQKTAENILSLIYLTIDGFNSPLLIYRKYSYQLLHDLNLVSKIETLILGMIAKITEYKKAKDEETRISQASDQA